MSDSSHSWEYVSLSLLCKGWPDFFSQFFATDVTELFMPGVTKKRKREWNSRNLSYIRHKCRLLEAQDDAKRFEREIDEANQAQIGLANMQTQFAALDSEFQIICSALAIFANTWAYVRHDLFFFSRFFPDKADCLVPCWVPQVRNPVEKLWGCSTNPSSKTRLELIHLTWKALTTILLIDLQERSWPCESHCHATPAGFRRLRTGNRESLIWTQTYDMKFMYYYPLYWNSVFVPINPIGTVSASVPVDALT